MKLSRNGRNGSRILEWVWRKPKGRKGRGDGEEGRKEKCWQLAKPTAIFVV
ncbi:MAG: hypothetical protein ACI4TP_07310 [Anaerotignum sp.]